MIRPSAALACCVAFVPAAAAAQRPITVPLGTPIMLVTRDALSSKTSVKGDMVRLETSADVAIDGVVVIPAHTEAVGQIADARAKGAMGMSGQLLVRPLYLSVGSRTVRLSGTSSDKASVTVGAVIGTIALRAPIFTGRSATIPGGTLITAFVERTLTLP